MGEIAMPTMSALLATPPELMAAMNIFGGSCDMTPLAVENGSQSGSFSDVLGLLMANSAQIQPVPELAETETPPEMTAADILSAALEGGNTEKAADLPEVFTEKGAIAFTETLTRILPEYDGEKLPKDTLSIWKEISPEEKTAFAELLYAAAEFSEDESIQTERSPEDIVRIICRIMVNSVRKSEKKIPDKADITDEAAVIQGMSIIRPVQTVSPDDMGKQEPIESDAMISAGKVTVQVPENDRLQAADTGLTAQTENAEQAKAQSAEKIPFTDVQSVYEKLSEADPEEIVSFCRKLADELNASVKETDSGSAAEASDNGHIEFGRQGMQGFMARVNRHEELSAHDNVQAIPPQVENRSDVSDITLGEAVPENEDIPSQIMRQIDLYRDIFEERFSEKELSVKLSPESLGGVEIKIKKSDKGFEITFTAEKAEAAELIGNKSSELQEALASRGIALKEMSVNRQIVTNESNGNLTDGGAFDKGDLYGGAQNGQTGSGRHFSFGGQTSSESSEQADESSSDTIINREAKLWVSA